MQCRKRGPCTTHRGVSTRASAFDPFESAADFCLGDVARSEAEVGGSGAWRFCSHRTALTVLRRRLRPPVMLSAAGFTTSPESMRLACSKNAMLSTYCSVSLCHSVSVAFA